MKGYIKYGNYDIWDKFIISDDYKFIVQNKVINGYMEIGIIRVNATKGNIDLLIEKEYESIKKDLKRNKLKYFKENFRKEILINGNEAILLRYQFNSSDMNAEGSALTLKTIENCYIIQKNILSRYTLKATKI